MALEQPDLDQLEIDAWVKGVEQAYFRTQPSNDRHEWVVGYHAGMKQLPEAEASPQVALESLRHYARAQAWNHGRPVSTSYKGKHHRGQPFQKIGKNVFTTLARDYFDALNASLRQEKTEGGGMSKHYVKRSNYGSACSSGSLMTWFYGTMISAPSNVVHDGV